MSVTNVQMESMSMISAAFLSVNEGFANSEIGIEMTIVYQGLVSVGETRGFKPTRLLCMYVCRGCLLRLLRSALLPCTL